MSLGCYAGVTPGCLELVHVPIPAAERRGGMRVRAGGRRMRVERAPVAFELGCFALAAVALIAAGATVAGIAFAVAAAVNAVLLAAFGQLEA